MKLKTGQRIKYRNGGEGVILTTDRNNTMYPRVSMTDNGKLMVHSQDGNVYGNSDYDIMPPVPQGRKLVGYLCGVSDNLLKSAQNNAKNNKHMLRIIKGYSDGARCQYLDTADDQWKYAWPVSHSDIKKYLWDGDERCEEMEDE